MPPIAFEIWDVFTDRAFGGNQLGVFPDARALGSARMQQLARELNFSETTFVLPPETPNGTARVRIFTPVSEIPFAGHPTVGTAIALAAAGTVIGTPVTAPMVLELGVGPVPCQVTPAEGAWSARFTVTTPLERLHEIPADLAARSLGLPLTALKLDSHSPVMASKGLPFVFVELRDLAQLSAARPDIDAHTEGEAQFGGQVDLFAIAPYVRSDQHTVHMRMFAPLSDIPEDPATGSAAAALGALLCDLAGEPVDLTLHQGVDMGRPSKIHVQAETLPDGTSSVQVGGQAVRTMSGQIDGGIFPPG